MKALPCDHCARTPPEWRRGGLRPSLVVVNGAAIAQLASGEPYLLGQHLGRWPLTFYCARCQRKTTLDAKAFHRLPDVSPDQLDEHGLLERYTRDLKVAGFTDAQAADLFVKHLTPQRVELLLEGLEPPT